MCAPIQMYACAWITKCRTDYHKSQLPCNMGYEAAEGIDWIWEHRIKDIEQLGI